MTRTDLHGRDVVGIRADNPGPFTLAGTNSWIVGRDPAYLVDPGPALPAHVAALIDELDRRGGVDAIVLTHDHGDHSESVPVMRERYPSARLAAGRGEVDLRLREGVMIGPLEAVFTPGHAPDHFSFVTGPLALTGDAVLGEGSVFIAPDPGALAGYLAGLARLAARELEHICPGHGPVVDEPQAKLREYVDHRLERERRLVAALQSGARTVDALLDAAWADVPPVLRPAATVTLAAHLDKLADEDRLPAGVQRPAPFPLTQPKPEV